MLRGLLVITATFCYVLAIGGPLLVYTVLSGRTGLIYRVGVLGARMAVWLAGVRLCVSGRDNIPAGRAVVYMMNHQSNCDPPAVVGCLPPVLILVKKEFFRVPILGRAMRLRGFIPVDRKSREQAIGAIRKAVESLKSGKSILVFPEGTRSPDGRLLPFKKGVFLMAIQAGVPVVPVSISGSRRVMPKGKFAMRPGVVRITFHNPVETRHLSTDGLLQLQRQVREAIVQGLAEDERPAESPAALRQSRAQNGP